MDTLKQARHFASLVDESTRRKILDVVAREQEVDELWEEYGNQLGLAATGEDPGELAKKSFGRRLSEIRRALCGNASIQAILNDPAVGAEIDLAVVLAGMLLESKFGGGHLASIAVLVSRIGLNKICRGESGLDD